MKIRGKTSTGHLCHECLQQVQLSSRHLTSTVTLTRLESQLGAPRQPELLLCRLLLLLCLAFLLSNCFHMAGNVILQLPLVISSPRHIKASLPLPPPSILSWGLKNSSRLGGAHMLISHPGWRQWAWPSFPCSRCRQKGLFNCRIVYVDRLSAGFHWYNLLLYLNVGFPLGFQVNVLGLS